MNASSPASAGPTTAASPLILGSLMVTLLLSALDTTIVSTAMPTIAGQFEAFELYAWVTTAYSVTSTIATLVLGKLSDLYGRRRMLLTTIAIFVIASLLCGAAQSMPQLIAARALQGIGGGGIWGLTFATVGDIVPPRERGKYMGLFSSMWGVAAIAGPLVGGLIVGNTSWRWIFLVNIPLGVAVFFLLAKVLKVPAPNRRPVLDIPGVVLLTVGVGALMLSLERGQSVGWSSPLILGGFALVVVCFVCFIWQERRAVEPVLPLRLFSNPDLRTSYILGFLIGPAMFAGGLFFSLYFQAVRFLEPTRAGLQSLPMMIGMVGGSTTSGRVISRIGKYSYLPRVGCPVAALASFGAILVGVTTSFWYIGVLMFFIGFGTGISMPALSIVAQNSAEARDLGVSSAVQNFMRSAGGAITIALLTVIFNSRIASRLDREPGGRALVKLIREPSEIAALEPSVRDAITDAITSAMGLVITLSGFVIAGAWMMSFLVRDRELRTTNHVHAAPE